MLDVKMICIVYHEMIFCLHILQRASWVFSVFQDRRCFQLHWTNSKLSLMQYSGTILVCSLCFFVCFVFACLLLLFPKQIVHVQK